MSALDFFLGKTVFVAGAGHPLGRSLCRRLSELGAQVIALDRSDVALAGLAPGAAHRIEPLIIDLADRASARSLREGWGEEPVDALFDLLPLSQPPDAVLGLFRALGPGLRAGHGRAVSLFPETADPATPLRVFRAAGWRAFLDALPLKDARHRVLGLPENGPLTAADVTRLGDLSLMLCHPAADAMADHSGLSAVRTD